MWDLAIITTGLLAIAEGAAVSQAAPFPLYFKYGGYPRTMTYFYYGTPRQTPGTPTVVDLGSASYWVYGANATINYGSPYLGIQGPCNITAKPSYNNTASTTATKPFPKDRGYSYGGNGKLVSSQYTVTNTLRFGNAAVPALTRRKIAISNYTLIKQAADNCTTYKLDYDHSILGLSAFNNPSYATVGPSFRQGPSTMS